MTDATGHTLSQISAESNTVVRDDIAVGNGAGPVTVGEGAVWVGNALDGTVSRVDPERGVETDVVRVGGRPDALAVGAGSIWVTNGDTASVSRIDPRKRVVVQTIPVGNGPRGIAVDGEAVWVANALDGTVSKIAATTGSVTRVEAVAPGVSSIVASGGAIWVASPPASKVFRIDRESAQVTDTIEMGSSPSALAAGTDGTVWAAALPPVSRHRGGTLVVSAYLSGCNCLDPAFAWQADAWRALSMLYDGLVAYRKTGGAPGTTLVPDLAVNLPSPTDGGRTYRFQLRRGLTYSDGSPVRASDFRASMERLLRLNGVSVPPFYSGILGAERCSAQLGRCDLRKGIEVDDVAGTVTIHLVAPDPDLLAKLALPFAFVLPADAPEPDQPVTDLDHFGDIGTYRIPGTGPYVAASFDPKHELRLTRNPRFKPFAPDAQPDGYPDQIVIRILGDGNTQERRSAVGEVEAGMLRLDDRTSHRRRSSGSLFETLVNSIRRPWVVSSISCSTRVSGRSPTCALAARSRMQSTAIAWRCWREASSWRGRPAKSCRRPCRDTVPTAPTRSTPPPGSGAPRSRPGAASGKAFAHTWRACGDRDSSGEPG